METKNKKPKNQEPKPFPGNLLLMHCLSSRRDAILHAHSSEGALTSTTKIIKYNNNTNNNGV